MGREAVEGMEIVSGIERVWVRLGRRRRRRTAERRGAGERFARRMVFGL